MLTQLPSHAGSTPAQIASTYAPNPAALDKRTNNPNIPPQLVDLLAKDLLAKQMADAKAATEAKLGGPQPTVSEQLDQETQDGARSFVKQSLGIAGLPGVGMPPAAMQGPQGMPPQGMAPPQGGLGAIQQGMPQQRPMPPQGMAPPQGMPQQRPMPPQGMAPPQGMPQQRPMPPQGMAPPQGLPGLRSNLGKYQQGGIVAFQVGGEAPTLEESAAAMEEVGEREESTVLPREADSPVPEPEIVPKEGGGDPEKEAALAKIMAIPDPVKRSKVLREYMAKVGGAAAPVPAAPAAAPAAAPPRGPAPAPYPESTNKYRQAPPMAGPPKAPPLVPPKAPPLAAPAPAGGLPSLAPAIEAGLKPYTPGMAQPEVDEERRLMGPGREKMSGLQEANRAQMGTATGARMAESRAGNVGRDADIERVRGLQEAISARQRKEEASPFARFRGIDPTSATPLASAAAAGAKRQAGYDATAISNLSTLNDMREKSRTAKMATENMSVKDTQDLHTLDVELAKAKDSGNQAEYAIIQSKRKEILDRNKVSMTQGVELTKAEIASQTNKEMSANRAQAKGQHEDLMAAGRRDELDRRTIKDASDKTVAETKIIENAGIKAGDAFDKGLSPKDKLHAGRDTPNGKAIADRRAAAVKAARAQAERQLGQAAGPSKPSTATQESVAAPTKGPNITLPGGGTARRLN